MRFDENRRRATRDGPEKVSPSETVAGHEARKHVVAPKGSNDAEREEREADAVSEERFVIDQLTPVGPLQTFPGFGSVVSLSLPVEMAPMQSTSPKIQ